MKVNLIMPCKKYWSSYKESLPEIVWEGDVKGNNWDGESAPEQYFSDAEDMRAGKNLDGLVPCTNFWIIVDEEYCGRMSIRHELNDWLRNYGGHIGYEVKTSMRRKGIASKALEQAINYCRNELNLNEVLLTCADDNLGSIKTIHKNGGILIEKKDDQAGRISRYYQIIL
ncbi:GNAT family N-acetyltransferase [Halobacteriovorax sp.]|uniref:GNAT family N-acetyltransferase n=1 Tax=Halobacteriovorax sp. TaxID=2020862 RepID=UPI0035681F62